MKTLRDNIITYVKDYYETTPDFPWPRDPQAAVLRHKKGKWYGLIMTISGSKLGLPDDDVEIINLKCEPEFNSFLKSRAGVFPAYHMNKEHWVTIILDGTYPEKEIYDLIDSSFELTK